MFANRPDILTRGEYYFTDDATPFYAHQHNLGSSNWHDANHPKIIRLGEVPGGREWRNGEAPVVAARESSIGNVECIRQGESADDALRADELIDGWPPECVLTDNEVDETWEEVSSYSSCATQRIYASLIGMMYANDEPSIRKTILDWLGASVVVSYTPHTGVRNGVVTLRMGDWSAAILDGTHNAQELALQSFKFPAPPYNLGAYSSAYFWFESSIYVQRILVENGLQFGNRFFIAGDSYGAAVSYNLLARFRAWNAETLFRYLTFACPKIGDQRMVSLIQSCEGMSIVNDSDFVPILPPDRLTLAPFLGIFAAPILLLYTDWKRPPSQWLLREDGELLPNQQTLVDYTTLFNLLTQVFEQRDLNICVPHFIASMIKRLETRCPNEEWPINDETQKDVWFPFDLIGLNGIKKPGGALILHGTPIPVPGTTCAAALELPLEDWYVLTLVSTVVAQWVFWEIPSGPSHTYTFDYEVVAGAALPLGELRLGNCASSVGATFSTMNASVPFSTVGGNQLIFDAFLLSAGTRTIRVRCRF